ncbi:(5-formylfuran-3-yl)methyl phosphate synthase [Desulfobacterales bacterium HSG17]|nr:(5-formylfuran-3-yl)methyl phosphate synthase [Desulfobacterales bacterium HSG17]
MQLLISVVNENEAKTASKGGADIIDVKNPHEGALGANFPNVIRRIRQCTPSVLSVSAAIGDAPDKPGATALAALGASVCNVQYVKVGLYGTKTPQQAEFLLKEVCRAVKEYDSGIKIIAAAYADAHRIGALPPMESPSVSSEAGADGCMLDTAVKDGKTLFSHLGEEELRKFVQNCHKQGLVCALAGSLAEADIPRISKIGPDIIGFRSAACIGDRVNGIVNLCQVEQLKNLISANRSPL